MLQKEGNSYYFIYFIIMGNNSDNFVLNKYNTSSEVSNISRISTISSLFTVSFSRESLAFTRLSITLKQLTMFTKALDTICFINTKIAFKMAGYFLTLVVLN